MELKLLRRGERIYCAPDALIYDEKTQEGGNFQNQRRRWLGDQKVHPHRARHYRERGVKRAQGFVCSRRRFPLTAFPGSARRYRRPRNKVRVQPN